MKPETKEKLFIAWDWCDDNDKSTEFMLQYMQDYAGVSLDTVMNFLEKNTDKQRMEWYNNIRYEK
jgi:hypothetical protein